MNVFVHSTFTCWSHNPAGRWCEEVRPLGGDEVIGWGPFNRISALRRDPREFALFLSPPALFLFHLLSTCGQDQKEGPHLIMLASWSQISASKAVRKNVFCWSVLQSMVFCSSSPNNLRYQMSEIWHVMNSYIISHHYKILFLVNGLFNSYLCLTTILLDVLG